MVNQCVLKKQSELIHYKDVLVGESKRMILREQEKIHLNENTVRLLNPENVLKRGYTLTLKEGKIVKSAAQLNLNEELETRFADGNVKSKIIKKDNNGN